jgi:HD-like signal output (HDOD) protein
MKRILFVDDDPALLSSLRSRLRRMRNTWDMEFVDSGREALERMERETFDVIVTDQRMPEMDGATLLRHVQDRWPRVVRIVLSGYSEHEQIVRLVPLAHQYVSKPCEPEQLENIVERCIRLQEMLQQPVLRDLVGRIGAVPAAPKMFTQLQAAMTSDSSSIADIAALVTQDAVLSAKLLQIVNSGFFRLPRRIARIEQAVGYLGLNTVRNLIVSADVFSMWPRLASAEVLSLDALQEHATRTAAAVVSLAPEDGIVANDAVLAALLHDIGYVLLSHGCPKKLIEARDLAVRESLPLDVTEREVLGASHAEIGAYLLGLWGFPSAIVEAVAYHHTPSLIPQQRFDALPAVCIAHALTEPSESAAFVGLTVPHSEIQPDYLERVKAPFSWDEAKRRIGTRLAAEGD